MKKYIAALLTAVMSLSALTGCGEAANTAGAITGQKKSYISSLEDGVFYVRDQENNCTPVYFGNGTFEEGSISTTPSDERVLWYKDDFEKVPTLYEGDSLIMFTKNEIEERMVFERFEVFPTTIGICGMEELKSGRYKIFTNPDKKCTYPYGDTDDILKLDNDSVILEKIGGQKVRQAGEDNETGSFLTRSGTLKGLDEGKAYTTEIYEGTIRHEYIFTADVIPLGSMEVTEKYDYEFETDNLINVKIPEFFNTGYYMINGSGLFRYVKGTSFDTATNFNIENVDPGDGSTVTVTQSDLTYASTVGAEASETMEAEGLDTFNIRTPGQITVRVSFTVPGNYGEGDGLEDVTALIESPSGSQIYMITQPDGSLSRSFYAEAGAYTIKYYNLDIRETHVTFE